MLHIWGSLKEVIIIIKIDIIFKGRGGCLRVKHVAIVCLLNDQMIKCVSSNL